MKKFTINGKPLTKKTLKDWVEAGFPTEKGGDDERAALEWEAQEQKRRALDAAYGGYADNRLSIKDFL